MIHKSILGTVSLALVGFACSALNSETRISGLLQRAFAVHFIGFRADSIYDKNGVLIAPKIRDGAVGLARVDAGENPDRIRHAFYLTLANETRIIVAGDLRELKDMTKADWESLQQAIMATANEAIDELGPE